MTNVRIDFLGWDSNFFGLKIGKIDLSLTKNLNKLNKFKKSLEESDYDLIYIFSDISQMPFPYFNKTTLTLIDTQIHLKMNMPLNIKPLKYELITKDNLPRKVKIDDLFKISDGIAPFSRFSYDSKISKKKVIELYHKFIENSLNGTFGKGLILDTEINGKLIGLFSIDSFDNIGKEIIIGIKKFYRGKGSGRRLFDKSLNYWKDRGVKEVKTIVSARNLDSLNFHLKLGFNIFKINNVYHLWLKD